ncbi:hypothetical protein MSSAC_1129 [Methanosarcina siciliae C2J]|uniref:DUF5305 domain-containing protein n=1 Tax=Methanosarcina siciliae C2J TaxID=1434118 RepID=A0A0E3PLM3_9EURY|nr:DUF5305 family protein [Methanosarcina siciliae]AKB35719.1 hypothetical protein MSSAC_1129 [Methanosarcina siciliae C2J]
MLEIFFLKLKNTLINNSRIFIVVLGIAVILSSSWAYEAYTQDVYEEQEELISSYTQHGKYTYTAPVTEKNPLYSKGSRLEMGKPMYFFAASPTLEVSLAYNLNATDSAFLRVECETVVVATSEENSGGSQEIIWKKEFPVEEMGYANIGNKDVLIHDFSVNVSEIRSKVIGIQDQLKYSSDTTIEIVTHVNYKGEINGEEINNTTDFALPLVINPAYYKMPEKLEFNENNYTYEKIIVKKEPSVSSIKLPLSLFLLSTILVGALIPCTKMNNVDPELIRRLKKEEKYSSVKEFVSKGKVPDNWSSLIQVEIYSLHDLVDAAVDMNERVVNDIESGVYFIIHDNILYVFLDVPSKESEDEN